MQADSLLSEPPGKPKDMVLLLDYLVEKLTLSNFAVSVIRGGSSPEDVMATHSSILAWRIPWTEESGRLWSVGMQSLTGLKRLGMHTCTL